MQHSPIFGTPEWREWCHEVGREIILALSDRNLIRYGQPCKRCNRPMVPAHDALEPGHVMHHNDGFCNTCEARIRRRKTPARVILDTVDDGIVDEIAVERAAKGDLAARATLVELRAAAAHLRKMDYSEYDIAFVLGMPLAFVREAAQTESAA